MDASGAGKLRWDVGTCLLSAWAAFVLAGCGSPAMVLGSGYCDPPTGVAHFPMDDEPPPGSSRDEYMAALVGLRRVLHEDLRDERARLVVLEHLSDARLAIASTSAELDCEARRAEQAADFLAHNQASTVQTLTIASIVAAAATGVGTVFASTSNWSDWTQNGIAIGGGVVTAGFGVASLYVQPTIVFEHPHNLLADIWNGPARSSSYAPIVWGYLTKPVFSNDQTAAIRVKLVQRWRHFHRVDEDPQTVALVFGTGGRYDLDALRMRAAMLEQVKSEVALSNQELAALAAHLRHLPAE